MPLTSVLLCTRNRPRVLGRAIQGVLEQTFRDWELLVINDGGVEVEEVALFSGDARIRYFSSPRNIGKAACCNLGLDQARGRRIAYLDDDDYWLPNHLADLNRALDENPGREAAYADLHEILFVEDVRAGRRLPLHKRVKLGREFNRNFLLAANLAPHLGLMHERDLALKVGGYDEEVKALIDWNMTRKLAFFTDFVHVRKVTGSYFAPVGPSDRITDIYGEQTGKRRQAIRKIKADLPPGPWPFVEKVAVILPLPQPSPANLEKAAGLFDVISHPAEFFLLTAGEPAPAGTPTPGGLDGLKNVHLVPAPRDMDPWRAVKHAVEKIEAAYLYLASPATPLDVPLRIFSALGQIKKTTAQGLSFPWGRTDDGFEVFIERSVLREAFRAGAGPWDLHLEPMSQAPAPGFQFDALLTETWKNLAQGNCKKAHEKLTAIPRETGEDPGPAILDLYFQVCAPLGQWKEIEDRLRFWIEKGYGGDNLVWLGQVLQAQKRFPEAVKAYGRGLMEIGLHEGELQSEAFPLPDGVDTAVFRAWQGLGECYLELNRLPQAGRMFRNARVLQPLHPGPFLGMAGVWRGQGKMDQAREALNAAEKLRGKNRDPASGSRPVFTGPS
ncbi:MAG: glycosyltransferase [Pseudomonadota bacterium]